MKQLQRWHLLTAVLTAVMVLAVIGSYQNEPLETHNNGATMCMACIGLE